MRAPSPEKAVAACFSLTIRQPTTSAIRSKRRTRSARAGSPPRARRFQSWRSRAAPHYRGRLVYGSAIRARSLCLQRHPRPFSAAADTGPTSQILLYRFFPEPSADGAWRVTSRGRSQSFRAAHRAPSADSARRENSAPPESARCADVPSQSPVNVLMLLSPYASHVTQYSVSPEKSNCLRYGFASNRSGGGQKLRPLLESKRPPSCISLGMLQDFKFAFRQLRRSPGFTAIAVLTLALAIGVNSAIFALINGVVLRPMIRLRPQEVVNVFSARQNASHDYRQFSYQEYRELREHGDEVFVDLAALEFAVAGIGRDHDMRRSFAFLTSENYFSLMGVQPFRGRFYNAEECKPNANIAVVVISYGFWKRVSGRNDFVGSTLQINGQPYTVIGITPDGFSGASALIAPDVWVPLGIRSQLGSAFGD